MRVSTNGATLRLAVRGCAPWRAQIDSSNFSSLSAATFLALRSFIVPGRGVR